MPRAAVKAIAASGIFCGVMTVFLAYFAWAAHFHPLWIWTNSLTALFLVAGSLWMFARLGRD